MLPRRPARSTSSAPISSATSNPARSSSSTTRACARSSPSRRRAASASSSISISPAPTRVIDGVGVYEARKRIGIELAKESPVAADIVVPVPDSGVPAAIGYAQGSGLPFELGIIRNHYVGRTFIEPTDHIRHLGVKLKHNANRALLEGKRVILVDDSIVRGTTSKKIVEMVRTPAPPKCTCASPPRRRRTRASTASTRRRARSCSPRTTTSPTWPNFIGVDSLAFVSIDGLYRAMGMPGGRDPEQPALLRRLLHRRLSDRARRPDRHRRSPALLPRRNRLSPLS